MNNKSNGFYYLASPLSSPTQEGIEKNMENAKMYCDMASKKMNVRVIAPHSFMPAYLNDNIPAERQLCLEFGINLLKMSKGLIICGDIITSGMQSELDCALENNIPLFFMKVDGGLCVIEDERGHNVCTILKEKSA